MSCSNYYQNGELDGHKMATACFNADQSIADKCPECNVNADSEDCLECLAAHCSANSVLDCLDCDKKGDCGKNGGGGNGHIVPTSAPKPHEDFLDRYKWWIMGGGIALVLVIVLLIIFLGK